MVECGGLENRCRFAPTQGSNPCLSANHHIQCYRPRIEWYFTNSIFLRYIVRHFAAYTAAHALGICHSGRQTLIMTTILPSSTYHLRKRVSQRVTSVEPRITIGLACTPILTRRPKPRLPPHGQNCARRGRPMLAGPTAAAEAYFEAVKQLAQARCFRYCSSCVRCGHGG